MRGSFLRGKQLDGLTQAQIFTENDRWTVGLKIICLSIVTS